jgi:hypothetical protein
MDELVATLQPVGGETCVCDLVPQSLLEQWHPVYAICQQRVVCGAFPCCMHGMPWSVRLWQHTRAVAGHAVPAAMVCLAGMGRVLYPVASARVPLLTAVFAAAGTAAAAAAVLLSRQAAVTEYKSLRGQLAAAEAAIAAAIQAPDRCLAFLRPGRLIRVKEGAVRQSWAANVVGGGGALKCLVCCSC